MIEWFRGEPKTSRTRLVPVMVRWLCPQEGCSGEMKYSGSSWPTGTPGYHHYCSVCGQGAAMGGKQYPLIEYEELWEGKSK